MKVFIVGDTGVLDGLALWSMTDQGDVLMYVAKDSIPTSVLVELKRLHPDEFVIVGGEARVSASVESILNGIATTSRIAGPSKFATATAISQHVHPIVLEPSPPSGEILWQDGFESGDWSKWKRPAISGRASAEVVTEQAYEGTYSLKLANWGVDGSHSAGVRMTPDTELWRPVESGGYPDDLYYSARFFIPFTFEGRSNFFQYKMSDATAWNGDGTPREHTQRMIWKISLVWDRDTDKYLLETATRVDQENGQWRDGPSDVQFISEPLVSVGEWFHVEVHYVWGKDNTGRATVWLNGELVHDQENMSTEANNLECMQWCRTWAVNHYLADYQGYVAPGDSWVFLDDAKMATYRVGETL